MDELIKKAQEVIDAIKRHLGFPPNASSVRTFAIQCVAANTPYRANDMLIPEGMALLIKASPANGVAAVVYVARSPAECLNINSSWPLVPNESIPYFVKNSNVFYVSSNVAGSVVIFTAEQRG